MFILKKNTIRKANSNLTNVWHVFKVFQKKALENLNRNVEPNYQGSCTNYLKYINCIF